MGFWNRKQEQREADSLAREMVSDPLLSCLLGGTAVTVEDALNVPSIGGCVGLIANAVANLPVKLYREVDGKVTEITDDYRLRLLNDETGDLLDAMQLKTALVRDYLLPGSGYAFVNWVGNRVESLHYIDPPAVSYQAGYDPIFKRVDFMVNGQTYPDFVILRLLRNTKDGIVGSGVITEAPEQIAMMYEAIRYEGRMVKTGAKKGFLVAAKKLTEDVMQKLKDAWRRLYSNSSENVVVLNEGISFQDAGQTAVETQLHENKQDNSKEICKLFQVAPALLEGQATDADLQNTVDFAIMPVIAALRSAFNRFLLLESEKSSYFFDVDAAELLKGDILKRYQAYALVLENGFLQIDEVRYRENRNPLGIKWVRLGLDTVLYDPATGMVYTPNTDKVSKLSEGRVIPSMAQKED